jgi:hypothetical protein
VARATFQPSTGRLATENVSMFCGVVI